MFQVKHVMSEVVFTVRPESTIDEVIHLLLDQQISGLPVTAADGELQGVITEIDVIGLVYDADVKNSIVSDHMERDVISLDAEASLDDAANIFSNHTIRRIPIVREGKLVGVVARRDLIRFVHDIRERKEQQRATAYEELAFECARIS